MKNMSKEQLIALLEQLVVVDEKTGIVYQRDENDILVPMENVTINNQDDKPKNDKLKHLNQYIDGLPIDKIHHHGTTLCYERYEKWCHDRSLTPTDIKTFVPTIMQKMGMSKKQAQMIVVMESHDSSLYLKPDKNGYVVGERKPIGEKARFTYFEID